MALGEFSKWPPTWNFHPPRNNATDTGLSWPPAVGVESCVSGVVVVGLSKQTRNPIYPGRNNKKKKNLNFILLSFTHSSGVNQMPLFNHVTSILRQGEQIKKFQEAHKMRQ